MNYTSIEQSKKLLELGLSPESADMNYCNICRKGLGYCDQYQIDAKPYLESKASMEELIKHYGGDKYEGMIAWEVLPCWSVGALLGLIPCPKLGFSMASTAFPWICTAYTPKRDIICEKVGAEMLEAAYNMIVWLLENNYIKND